MTTTMQRIELDSKDGKKFLRRIVRDNDKVNWDEEWRAHAASDTEWKLRFYRTQKGEIGDADAEIEVQTGETIGLPGKRSIGNVLSFDDAEPVYVAPPKRLHLSGRDAATVAQFIADGYTIKIEASAGSSNSSRHGLAFYYVLMTKRHADTGRYVTVQLYDHTVTKDGQVLCSGNVLI